MRTDARRLDEESIAVGPFARLDANAVASLEGKTRGAITNVFRSQAAFRAEIDRLGDVVEDALDHFGLELREGVTTRDLASAIASLVEGVWLNQCLTTSHPSHPSEPIATLMGRSGRLLWFGATVAR